MIETATTAARRTLMDEARMFARFVRGLRGFFSESLVASQCADVLQQALESRGESFLVLMRRCVYGNPTSPYRELLRWAGVEYADLVRMVRQDGVEGTLETLFAAGVRVTIDEFKGRTPIRCGPRVLEVTAADFDNPTIAGHFEGATGGSRGQGRRLIVDLDLVAHDAAAHGLFLDAFRIRQLPLSVWRPVAPGAAGTKKLLMHSKLHLPMDRWFSQNHPGLFRHPKSALFTGTLVAVSRWRGAPIPTPQYCPLSEVHRVVDWMSDRSAGGIHFDTNVSSAIRLCLCAQQRGLSLQGVYFRLGGEPLTRIKKELIERLGARVSCHYSVSEVGHVGIACAGAEAPDDVHFLGNKMGLIVQPAPAPLESLSAFYLTTLRPTCPKIMVNVATGDYGHFRRRDCGCAIHRSGLDLHLHGIRSYEKLTTAGMQFLGADLIELLDRVLPERFGGGPTDYQFVEEEERDGSTTLQILAHPRVGPIDEVECLATIYRFLSARAPENTMMVDRLRDQSAVRLVRRAPHATQASKILPLQLLRPTDS